MFDAMAREFVGKQLLAGILIAVAMAGMDQEMMQKNISVRTLADSQKNVVALATIMLVVVLAFLYLGGLLHLYAASAGMSETGDRLFPAVVMGHLPAAVQVIFFIALVSALFPSADGALTALTSSFCVDVLRLRERSLHQLFREVEQRRQFRRGARIADRADQRNGIVAAEQGQLGCGEDGIEAARARAVQRDSQPIDVRVQHQANCGAGGDR